MRIVIDARWIFEEISGVGSYTSAIIEHISGMDHDNDYILLFSNQELLQRTVERARFNKAARIASRIVPCGVFSLKSQWILPRLLGEMNADIYHSPNYFIPFRAFPRNGRRTPRCVVNVHDVIPLVMPDAVPRSRKRRLFPLYRRLMREVGARADAIVTGSQCARNDILEHLAIPCDHSRQVVSIANGVAKRFTPSAHQSTSSGRSVLYVGRRDPYKNLVSLVEAFALLLQRGINDITLRVVGPPDDRYPEAVHRARDLGVNDRVIWVNYVTDDELVKEYQQASVLALPSQYEGFGLPVLEAMACGTPVVCSDRSSLPEVAGEAARLVDPGSPSAMADAIAEILANPETARELREKGLIRASMFSWEKTARETIGLYRAVFSGWEGRA